MEETIGREMMKLIYKSGLSLNVFSIAVRITRMCDCQNAESICKVIRWLINHNMIGRVMKAIEGGQDPHVIMKAVHANRPIKMTLMVS